MNKINYQKELDRVIEKITGEGKVPKLLLHVCCAPCSSYCLEYLSKYFDITVYFYNPNISIADEYNYRLSEEKRLVSLMPFEHPVKVVEGEYLPKDYFEYVKGLENEPEGGKRCEKCFRLRLESSARYAKEHGFHIEIQGGFKGRGSIVIQRLSGGYAGIVDKNIQPPPIGNNLRHGGGNALWV